MDNPPTLRKRWGNGCGLEARDDLSRLLAGPSKATHSAPKAQPQTGTRSEYAAPAKLGRVLAGRPLSFHEPLSLQPGGLADSSRRSERQRRPPVAFETGQHPEGGARRFMVPMRVKGTSRLSMNRSPVAQASSLPYRRLPVCVRHPRPSGSQTAQSSLGTVPFSSSSSSSFSFSTSSSSSFSSSSSLLFICHFPSAICHSSGSWRHDSRFLTNSHRFSRFLACSHNFSLILANSRYRTPPHAPPSELNLSFPHPFAPFPFRDSALFTHLTSLSPGIS
jgi:hypothetical protein